MERLSIDEVIAHCNRQTRDYERLIGKTELENADISLNFIKQYWEHRQVAEWLRELKTYKDAEEQGLLLRLPCPIGTTVYCIEDECEDIYIEGSDYRFVGEEIFDTWMLDQFGKTVFITEEEAEQALTKLEGK